MNPSNKHFPEIMFKSSLRLYFNMWFPTHSLQGNVFPIIKSSRGYNPFLLYLHHNVPKPDLHRGSIILAPEEGAFFQLPPDLLETC